MISVKIDNEILSRIVQIERFCEKVSIVQLPVVLSNKFRKNSKKKSSYASNKIEGNPLTEAEAFEAIDSSKRHYLKPEQEIRNYYEALTYLEKEIKRKTAFSRDLILAVQAIVVKGESSEKVGLRGPMPPGVLFAVYDETTGKPDYIPPESRDIEGLLNELVEYVRVSDDHPLIKAAVVHYQLVTIHPFEDGNGRTARLLSDYILDQAGFGFNQIGSLEEYFAYDIDEYYRSLQMGLPPLYYEGRENPPHPEVWVNYFLRMMELYAKKVVEVATQSVEDRESASLSFLNTKERHFYEYLKKHQIREYSPIEMSKIFSVTNRTIINWSVALAENGLTRPLIVNSRVRAYQVV